LNPADLELLRQVNSPLLLPHHDAAGMRFQAGADIDRGGCRVQTRFGVLDARREVKIELTKKAVQS
jgi:flagellar biosynthesis/type III secretory pathway protein FliH